MNSQFKFGTWVVLSTIAVHFAFDVRAPRFYQPEKAWHEKAAVWLLNSQSENGGWGNASFAMDGSIQSTIVETDPATTAFAAMALLESGGVLQANPYKQSIMQALDCILDIIEQRPANGRITTLTYTQPQRKLGMHIDASMALDFLTTIRNQVGDVSYQVQIDSAAKVCITLLAGSQNQDGQWKDGGWAPVLQDVVNVSSLENAANAYKIPLKVNIQGSRANATNYYIDGIRANESLLTLDGAAIDSRDAGVPLYRATSVMRATTMDAVVVEDLLSAGDIEQIRNLPTKNINAVVSSTLNSRGIEKKESERLARSYSANVQAKEALRTDNTWVGFGNNGGEEYLSYKLFSESLEKQNPTEWLDWKTTIEPKFKSTQNPNGSWSGHHCITSPVFCTAAVLLAWHGQLVPEGLSAKR
jgi:hypothetical protein